MVERTEEAMAIKDIHDCTKSNGKIVGIVIDKLGNTYCGYCGKKVDYSLSDEELPKCKFAIKYQVRNKSN